MWKVNQLIVWMVEHLHLLVKPKGVESRDRDPGTGTGTLPSGAEMGAGRPRHSWNLARDTENNKKSFYRYISHSRKVRGSVVPVITAFQNVRG